MLRESKQARDLANNRKWSLNAISVIRWPGASQLEMASRGRGFAYTTENVLNLVMEVPISAGRDEDFGMSGLDLER